MDETKPLLRTRLRAMRREYVADLGPAGREAQERALARILAPLLAGASCIAAHAARGPEINPRWITAAVNPLAFPRVVGDTLEFRSCRFETLRPGYANILEPGEDAPLADPDIVLVPLVGVAIDGTRLGQGGGFYDRALEQLRQRRAITAIGIAWDVQLLPVLPHDPWDERLDWVATPSRLVDCAGYR